MRPSGEYNSESTLNPANLDDRQLMERNTENNSKIGNQIFDVEQFTARDDEDMQRPSSRNKKVTFVRSHTPKPVSRKVQDLEDSRNKSDNQRALSPRNNRTH